MTIINYWTLTLRYQMGKVKKVTYKRKLRHIQKTKKRLKAAEERSLNPKSANAAPKESNLFCQLPKSPRKSTPQPDNSDIELSASRSLASSSLSSLDKYQVQEEKVSSTMHADLQFQLEQANRELYFYEQKLKQNEMEMQIREAECKRKVRSIRNFWRDKIYLEGTRGGRILKNSLQNH